ncbi:hypothetical protein GGR58DRAFT_222749 [Xylaria digitata]|nr:hypothetical protein GGR58DRAFT_222749 [Xylaria digitata]
MGGFLVYMWACYTCSVSFIMLLHPFNRLAQGPQNTSLAGGSKVHIRNASARPRWSAIYLIMTWRQTLAFNQYAIIIKLIISTSRSKLIHSYHPKSSFYVCIYVCTSHV